MNEKSRNIVIILIITTILATVGSLLLGFPEVALWAFLGGIVATFVAGRQLPPTTEKEEQSS